MGTIYDDLNAQIPSGAFVVNDIDADVDIASPKYWRIKGSNVGSLNIVALVTALTAGLLEIYKAPTLTADGTDLTPQLMDQNTDLTPDSEFAKDSTVSADGTLIYTQQVPADYKEVAIPKMIFQKGIEYNIKFTSIADDNKANLRLVCDEK